MPTAQRKAITNFRRRLKGKGWVRLEVKARKTDASLVRDVVSALERRAEKWAPVFRKTSRPNYNLEHAA